MVRDQKIAYSIEEASALSGIGRNTIRRLVEWGKLPVLKVGRKILIRSDSLDKFISMNEGRDLLIKDEVKAVGANINQIAHRINTTRSIYQTDMDEIKKEVQEI